METGSYLTAHTTIQTTQTAEIVADRKKAGFTGIFAGFTPQFWSLKTPAVF
jgi:hypothetical protein